MPATIPEKAAPEAAALFSSIPGLGHAPPGSGSLEIARELIGRALQETSAAAAVPPSSSAGPETVSSDDAVLETVARAFEAIRTSSGHVDTGAIPGLAPPRSNLAPAAIPLREHADNLVRQQTYRDKDSGHSSLREFVDNIQFCRENPGSGAGRNFTSSDPFARLLESSLPHHGKLSARPAFNVTAIRRDFPILGRKVHGSQLVWFDNAATTQKPRQVIDGLKEFYEHDNSNIHRGAHSLAARATDAFEGARDKIRDYLNAGSSDEIVFVRGATEGINLVAYSYAEKFLQPGDEILLSQLEHHANIVPWQIAARKKGAVLRVIPVNDRGEILMSEYEKLLGPRTRLVGLAHANNSLGTVLPVQEMTFLAKRHGAHVLIDGAQSVAHLPVDVQALGVDFFVFSGHKIFGPTGIGAVYAGKELLEQLPPWQGGGNMIRDVTFEETVYSDAPARFEAGTPNVADAYGLGLALDYVRRIGLADIAAYEHRLLEYATEQLRYVNGLTLVGTARDKVAVTSFVLRDKAPLEVGRYLDQRGIAVRAGHHCAQPSLRRFGLEATVRPSFSFYNTFEEIDRLVHALKQIR